MSLPCVNPDLEIYFETNGKISVFHKKLSKTYMLGKNEYNVLKNLDGIKTLEDLSKYSKIYSVTEIAHLIEQFEKLGFIERREIKNRFNLIKIRKPLLNGNRIINPKRLIWKMICFILIFLSIPLLVIGIIVNIPNLQHMIDAMKNNIFTLETLMLLPITLFSLSLHELGHAVVARCFNINVPEIGIMLYWFMPCAYTNLNGITFVEQQWKRNLSIFAGILVNVSLSSIGLLFLNVVTGKVYNYVLLFVISNLSIIIINLLVFLKLDGYFLLEELLNLKGLRKKAFLHVKSSIRGTFAKRKSIAGKRTKYKGILIETDESSLDHMIFYLYVLFTVLYIPLILLSIGILVYDFILR